MARLGRRRSRRSTEIRREYGDDLSDEELLLRYLIPGPDVDAMYAAAHRSSRSSRPRRPAGSAGSGT